MAREPRGTRYVPGPAILGLHRHRDTVEGGELVRRAVEHPLEARAVVAAELVPRNASVFFSGVIACFDAMLTQIEEGLQSRLIAESELV